MSAAPPPVNSAPVHAGGRDGRSLPTESVLSDNDEAPFREHGYVILRGADRCGVPQLQAR
jgi:hypothetical protein